MPETTPQQNIDVQSFDVNNILLENIQSILSKLNIEKIYLIDDVFSLDTNNKDVFIGMVNTAFANENSDKLKKIVIENGIDFNTDQEVISEHISEKWDDLSNELKIKYFKKVWKINGQPEVIKDLDSIEKLRKFFKDDVLVCFSPNQWDEKIEDILQ